MNIQPVKTDAVQVAPKASPKSAPSVTETPENQNIGRKERLAEALAQEPAIRPEMLDRARELAADPNYPGPNVFAKLAARMVEFSKRAK